MLSGRSPDSAAGNCPGRSNIPPALCTSVSASSRRYCSAGCSSRRAAMLTLVATRGTSWAGMLRARSTTPSGSVSAVERRVKRHARRRALERREMNRSRCAESRCTQGDSRVPPWRRCRRFRRGANPRRQAARDTGFRRGRDWRQTRAGAAGSRWRSRHPRVRARCGGQRPRLTGPGHAAAMEDPDGAIVESAEGDEPRRLLVVVVPPSTSAMSMPLFGSCSSARFSCTPRVATISSATPSRARMSCSAGRTGVQRCWRAQRRTHAPLGWVEQPNHEQQGDGESQTRNHPQDTWPLQ